MASDVYRDPFAPDPGVQQLVSVRDFYDTKQTWVCCRISVPAFCQPRCPSCGALMQVAK